MFLLRLLVYVVCCAYLVLALPGAGAAFADAVAGLVGLARQGDAPARAFLLGAAAFLPLAWLLRAPLRFWYALAHELSHGLAALALGGSPGAMEVAATGEGKVVFARMPIVLWLVLLAPYVLSPFYLVPLLVPWLRDEARVAGAAVAGLATAFTMVANGLQVRAYQSDIRRAGLVRALLFIAWGNLVAAALSIALVTGGLRLAGGVLRLAALPRLS